MLQEFTTDVMSFSCPINYLEYMNSPEYLVPNTIFSDVHMPHMNGYELMAQVRQTYPFQKFVMVSGNTEIEHEIKHMACMFLCKPFMFKALEEVMTALNHCHEGCTRERVGCAVVGDADAFNISKLGNLNDPNG